MEAGESNLLKELLSGSRVMALGVLVEDKPYVSLVPYALTADWGAFLIRASRLARHTAGLTPGAPFSAMIHAIENPDDDPLQIARASFQGVVEVLADDSPEFDMAKNRYLDRFPTSAQTFLLGDFSLYSLHVRKGRLVAGFARTLNLFPHHLAELARSS